jgi:PRTRC genetic system protein B
MNTQKEELPALRRRPWLRRKPRPIRQTMVIDRAPEVQIGIFEDAIYLTRRQGRGWVTYPISPEDLAAALSKLPTSSGLLPPNTLGTGTVNGQCFYVLYVLPRPAALRIVNRKQPHTIQTPPLIWAGCGQDYRIFALNSLEPPQAHSALYHAPFPNTYDLGSICWGTADRRSDAAPETMLAALTLYLEGSYFNSHIAQNRSRSKPRSVMALYRRLSAETPYPLDDLVPAGHDLGWLLSGQAWRERGLR